jgi:hypothetical protein
MANLTHLKKAENLQKLNALLHIYDYYKDMISWYLKDPENELYKTLNIYYIRKLVPEIKRLVNELELDSGDIKIPVGYILASTLFSIEKEFQHISTESKTGRVEAFDIYGKIKNIAEDVGAIVQTPVQQTERIINEGKELSFSFFEQKKKLEQIKAESNNIEEDSILIEVKKLKYENGYICFKGRQLNLEPQSIILCKAFIDSKNNKERITSLYNLRRAINPENPNAAKDILQGAVSKLRCKLRSEKTNISIKNKRDKGYQLFLAKVS